MWTSWAGTSHYHQYRITQQYCSKNDYDREKWENMAILIVKYLHLKKNYPLFHWEIIIMQEIIIQLIHIKLP